MGGFVMSSRLGLISLTLALCPLACVDTSIEEDPNAIAIGALLPFTGEAVAGANIERALILGAERINAAGGVAGKHIRIVSRNTKSDPTEGLIACHELIDDDKVAVIIGPEEEAVAGLVVPVIEESGVLMVSGGLTSPLLLGLSPPQNWFRVTPSPLLLGQALAQRMRKDGVARILVVWAAADDFSSGFSGAVAQAFREAGGEVLELVSFAQSESSYAAAAARVRELEPDAIVLVSYPKSGAALVQTIEALSPGQRWYLAPTLKTDQFVKNVPPSAGQNMTGVSLAVSPAASSFQRAFAKRWDGEQPLISSHYFYDALMVAALAIETAAKEKGELPSIEDIRAAVRPVSNAPGKTVAWDDQRTGLSEARAGHDIDYTGVSGPVDIAESGEVTDANYVYWRIQKSQIRDEADK
jgi:branched-chain amino acid transport system substrate-binding protein